MSARTERLAWAQEHAAVTLPPLEQPPPPNPSLEARVETLEAANDELVARVAVLEQQADDLELRVAALEAASSTGGTTP